LPIATAQHGQSDQTELCNFDGVLLSLTAAYYLSLPATHVHTVVHVEVMAKPSQNGQIAQAQSDIRGETV
jgi:hypothetical protein